MGVDKEAMDIWKFGRKRPDLTFDETLAAPTPVLSDAEQAERLDMIGEDTKNFERGATAMARAFVWARRAS